MKHKLQLAAALIPAVLLVIAISLAGFLPSSAAPPQASVSTYVVLQSDAITNTNGTAVTPITVADSFSDLTVQVTGIVSATVTWEATIDGTNWKSILAKNLTSGNSAATTTADGLFWMDTTGLPLVRARVSGLITTTTDTIDIAGFLAAP